MSSGYLIDHVPERDRCCEVHNINCEPPAELCCDSCAEADHYRGVVHVPCVLDACACTSTQQHADMTQPGYAGGRVGMREPKGTP